MYYKDLGTPLGYLMYNNKDRMSTSLIPCPFILTNDTRVSIISQRGKLKVRKKEMTAHNKEGPNLLDIICIRYCFL